MTYTLALASFALLGSASLLRNTDSTIVLTAQEFKELGEKQLRYHFVDGEIVYDNDFTPTS